ncbi:major capsid protein [Peromfec virus RodF8_48]|uniref:Major capsid protein n=1 Tax=Peromfec virus RodF8_48 TaxID=2929379 RepID=A0A976R8D7_9VIRU|nr:major capsid protein [Peromfec virus RodF8_48]
MNNTKINKFTKLNQEIDFVKNNIVKIGRSTFPITTSEKTTFNLGQLVPLHWNEVIPGDTFEFDFSSLIRLNSPLIRPVMDDVRFDVFAFFVPFRLVWDNWESFIGNYQKNPDWFSNVNLTVPTIEIPTGGFALGSVADHLGIAPGRGDGVQVSHLPFRTYGLIWDEWFRDENLQNSIVVNTSNDNVVGVKQNEWSENASYLTNAILGGPLCPANKIHDLFTSALPAPQKGQAPVINIGGTAPVITAATNIGDSLPENYTNPLYWGDLTSNQVGQSSGIVGIDLGSSINSRQTVSVGVSGATYSTNRLVPANLVADLSTATGITINDLRYFFQSQMILEADARYGSRYTEILRGHYGVISSDARLQRPEFLGSKTWILDINQTVQTSSTDTDSPQSNLSGYSQTFNRTHLFTKSFTEHGYIMILGAARINRHSYSEGVNKLFNHSSRFDFYFPELAHIGEQPIKNKEIWLQNKSVVSAGIEVNEQVFGYQEAFYEYRYRPNTVSGLLRPDAESNIAVWTYVDDYDTLPTLSGSWVEEDYKLLDRALVVQASELTPQFLVDFTFTNKATRPLPLHSTPGLIDHSGNLNIWAW